MTFKKSTSALILMTLIGSSTLAFADEVQDRITAKKRSRIASSVKNTGKQLLGLATAVGAYAGYQYYQTNGERGWSAAFEGMPGGFFAANLASSLITPHLTTLVKESSGLLGSLASYMGYSEIPYQKVDALQARLEAKYENSPDLYSEKSWTRIEGYFASLQDIARGHVNPTETTRLTKLLETILSLPESIQKIPFRKGEERNDVNQRLDTLLHYYDPTLQKDLKTLGQMIAVASNRTPSPKTGKVGVFPIYSYFLGAPGTGKTYAVESLAQTLGLRICTIRLDQMRNEADLVGSREDIGALAGCIIASDQNSAKPNSANFVLFIDEFTQGLTKTPALLNILMRLTDPDKTSIYIDGLGIEVKKDRIIIVMAGNDVEGADPLLTNPNFHAFRTRMRRYLFPKFPEDKRGSFARTYLDRQIEAYDDLGLSEEISDEKRHDFVQKVVEADQTSGVRALMIAIDEYLNHVLISGVEEPFDIYRALRQTPPTVKTSEKSYP